MKHSLRSRVWNGRSEGKRHGYKFLEGEGGAGRDAHLHSFPPDPLHVYRFRGLRIAIDDQRLDDGARTWDTAAN